MNTDKSKVRAFLQPHGHVIGVWITRPTYSLWLKHKGSSEFVFVPDLDTLNKIASKNCDLVCSPIKPEMVKVGNIWCVAPVGDIGPYTVKDSLDVYAPNLTNQPPVTWQYDLAIPLTLERYQYPAGKHPTCFLRREDAIKYSKAIRKVLKRSITK